MQSVTSIKIHLNISCHLVIKKHGHWDTSSVPERAEARRANSPAMEHSYVVFKIILFCARRLYKNHVKLVFFIALISDSWTSFSYRWSLQSPPGICYSRSDEWRSSCQPQSFQETPLWRHDPEKRQSIQVSEVRVIRVKSIKKTPNTFIISRYLKQR